ncbi:Predicted metal-dependent phosphohydrolase, HD superfamily [Alteromonadaceae bacterium Bs31]|nr:Predicted metal-dependent phosphohydrolase, HD superfamily [Alteromonadaceae bacterium Bs31]
MTFERWQQLMLNLGCNENKDVFYALLAAYSEKHRYYHNSHHIKACLRHLDNTAALACRPYEVELALWFHDVVYVPRKSNNELKSAQWAAAFLGENKCPGEVLDRVYSLIMSTLHNSPVHTEDEKLLMDIDLSILGATDVEYDEFETAIRKEYQWVPCFFYKKKRKEILEGFLNRKQIYATDYFFSLLEEQARSNVTRAISHMQ